MQRRTVETKRQQAKRAAKKPPVKAAKPKQTKQTTKKPPVKAAKAKQTNKNESESSLFKFRRYKKLEGGKNKKAKHPKLIVNETKSEFEFMGLTEEEKSGHHKNILLVKNPKNGDTRKAYVRKEIRKDIRENFGEILANYNLSEKDKLSIIEYIEKRKKKK